MGKGDIKTRRGKITNGSYGKLRPRKKATAIVNAKPTSEKPEKAPVKKAAAKTPAAAKKTATTAKKAPAKKATTKSAEKTEK